MLLRAPASTGLPRRCTWQWNSTSAPRRSAWLVRSGPEDQQTPSSSSSDGKDSTSTDAATSTTPTAAEAAQQQGVPGPLPGTSASLQIPQKVIEQLRTRVFGLDTMWVTSVENYQEAGVVFKGNVRANNVTAGYKKMQERLKDAVGDEWQIFLVEDKEEKPTAIVLPSSAREGVISATTEIWLTTLFAVLTAVTTINSAGVPLLQFLVEPFLTSINTQDVLDALPLALGFWFLLGAHEWGHRQAAKEAGVQLYWPLIVPAGFGFLGSFGGLTRFRGFVPDREVLLKVASAGPAVGTAASAAFVLVGFGLSAAGAGDITIDSPAFADSFLMAVLGQAFLGDALAQPEVQVSSLLVAGWAGLVVNALNMLPTGELDGGRISLALYGRRASRAVGVLTIIGLSIWSFSNPLLFYWVLYVLVLQRGPILPCQQELAPPSDASAKQLGSWLYLLPLLVLPGFPVDLIVAFNQLQDPAPF